MKKLNILLLSALALGITITSCSKKEDSPATSGSSIVGKWKINTYTISNSTGTSDIKPYDPDATCTDKSNYELKAGTTMNEHSVGDDSSSPCAAVDYPGTYTYKDNNLHIVEAGGTIDYTVVSMTSDKLILSKTAAGDTYTYTLTK
jgi:hypothetical protein